MCYHQAGGDPKAAARLFLNDLLTAIGSKKPQTFDAVVISGDLTWQGEQSGFDVAIELGRLLVTECWVSQANLLLVPGNHDMWRIPDPYEEPPRIRFESRPKAEKPYRDFYQSATGVTSSSYLSAIKVLQPQRIALLGFNSSRFEGFENAGLGYVGGGQIAHVLSEFWNAVGDESATDFCVVAVMHHHVLAVGDVPWQEVIKPRDKRRFSLLLDCESVLENLLQSNSSLILHGHLHATGLTILGQPQPGAPTSFVAISSVGSAGLTPPVASATEFQIIRINDTVISMSSFRAPYTTGGRQEWKPPTEQRIRRSLVGRSGIRPNRRRLLALVMEERLAAVELSWLEAGKILYGDQQAEQWFRAEYSEAAQNHEVLSRHTKRKREQLYSDLLQTLRTQPGGPEELRQRANGATFLQYFIIRLLL